MNLEKHLEKYDKSLRELILKFAGLANTISKGFISRQSMSDTKNIYGEEQAAMDKWADEIIINELRTSGIVKYLASEEQPDVLEFNNAATNLGVTIDPLDGSSLLGINLTVGTIVGIYDGGVLLPGKNMLGAMYILYGPLTTLTYTLKDGVHEFVMNDKGEFIIQHENLRISGGKIYAPGALRKDYLPAHKEFIEELEVQGYKLRFSGSFVADVHQILHKGGVFTYPAFRGKEKGKLRLLFEANPMGFIVNEAGGRISNGISDILEINPSGISDRIPIYVGGTKEIGLIESLNRKYQNL